MQVVVPFALCDCDDRRSCPVKSTPGEDLISRGSGVNDRAEDWPASVSERSRRGLAHRSNLQRHLCKSSAFRARMQSCLQMSSRSILTATEAAAKLGVSSQSVRNWIRGGNLIATKGQNGRWLVAADSVEHRCRLLGRDRLCLGASDAPRAESGRTAGDDSERLIAALERERDRHRSDAAAARAAAIELNAAAREIDGAVRHLLDVLTRQSDALTQLLAPGTPEDLTQ